MLYSGEIVDNTYQVINEIGSGGMGVVYLAYHIRLKKYVVLKKIKGNISSVALLRNEVDILKGLHHPYLPQVYDYIEYGRDIYTVIDYIDGYDLDYYIKNGCRFGEGQLIKWLTQLCSVLEYLHSRIPPIIHLDIKPANIIITAQGDVCLIDFGISLSANDRVKGFSKNYSSPEQYENVINIMKGNTEYLCPLDARTDIYSLGATFYHLMTGYLPDIENTSQPALSQFRLEYSDALVSIIDKSMEREKEKRFQTAGKMLDAVENIQKYDKRYKKYILAQALSSVLAGIMIISGVFFIISGNNEQIKTEYNNSYSEFYDLYEKGDSEAAQNGIAILNNSSYSKFIDNKTRARIFHTVGDCFYNGEDYSNAVQYYKQAAVYADYDDEPENYYRDYAFSLINSGRAEEARRVMQDACEKYPGSPVIKLINARLELYTGNAEKAVVLSEECLSSVLDSDNRYTAYIILGDAYLKSESYDEAVAAYEAAGDVSTDIAVLRKLGAAYLEASDKSYVKDSKNLEKAKQCYLEIKSSFVAGENDIINLSQTYRLLGDYGNAETLLLNLAESYPDDYRVYIQLAFLYSESRNSRASQYCRTAKELYMQASPEEKSKTAESDIEKFKGIYEHYCSEKW